MSNRYSSYDEYGLRHLPQHLVRCGRGGKLREMLFEFDWLQAKLDATEVTSLLADYDQLPGDEALRQVQGALRLSAHIYASDKSQLASRLTGQLLSSASAENKVFLKRIRESKKDPWLRPLTPSFTPPNDPLLYTLMGNEDPVTALAVTPDGKRAISWQFDVLHMWDLDHGTMLSTMQAPASLGNALAVTPDGRHAILGGMTAGTIYVWDLEKGTEYTTLQGHTFVITAVAVTSDGKRVVSASKDKTLKLWDLERGVELATLQRDQEVSAVAVTLDGKRAISAGEALKVWDLEHGKELATLEGRKLEDHWLKIHTGWASQVAVTLDGCYTVSGTVDTLTLWDLKSGKEISTLWDYRSEITAVAVTPDGKLAVSGGLSSEPLKVWDLEKRKKIATLEGHTNEVTAVVITLDGKRVISASKDGTLKVWSLSGDMKLATHEGHTGSVTSLTVTIDGKRAICGTEYDILKVWDLEHGIELSTMKPIREVSDLERRFPALADAFSMNPPSKVTAVTITPDGRHVVSGSQDNTLKVWNLERGTELATLRGHEESVTAVAITPDGKRIISGSQDNTLKVWDLERGTELATFRGHEKSVTAVAVTPDGKHVVSGSWDQTLKVWDLEHGTELATLRGHKVLISAVAVTPDGRYAVSGDIDNILKVWDLEHGTKLATLQGHKSDGLDTLKAIALTPDGRYAVSGESSSLTVWDLENLKTVATFIGDAEINTCEIAVDGSTVIAGDKLERVHVLRLENVLSGPFVVTAWQFSTRVLFLKWDSFAYGCPSCRNWSKIHLSELGTEIACSHCNTRITLNSFTIKADWHPIADAWSAAKNNIT